MASYEYVIVGSGSAGLFAALSAAEYGSVVVITKSALDEANTKYAQGGVAAAIGEDDDPALHLEDTLIAGAGLVDPEAARILTSEAHDRIDDLMRYGVPFDRVDGEITMGQEGAHSRARIIHAGGDATGAHIEVTLAEVARHANITLLEYTQVVDIIVDRGAATGVVVLDTKTNQRDTIDCRHLILATGGGGQLYKISTNPVVATADGVALGYRAGAEVTDMEFFQFHPTALRLPGVPSFLISEAVRGEGGLLFNSDGERFMPNYDARLELAPRDIVARAIVAEMARTGVDHVYLDVTHLPAEHILLRFPSINAFCLQHGVDMTKQRIPVSPAAHYMMGGVRTNEWGETNIANLYACGEAACTGVHGANRLASNSLLETLVFAKRVVERSRDHRQVAAEASPDAIRLPDPSESKMGVYHPADAPTRIGAPARALLFAEKTLSLENLQSLMWDKVGIERDGAGLAEAALTLAMWQRSAHQPNDRASQELSNLLVAARLAAEGALIRQESRGAHYRTDFPETLESWRHHIVFRKDA